MEKRCKPRLGQFVNGRLYLTNEEKLTLIKDYLSGKETKKAVYFRYTGYAEDHGKIARWMHQLGVSEGSAKSATFVSMAKSKKKADSTIVDFEKLQLQKRIAELEK